ncbi:MAG: gamma-glutamylcyclotransferase family protein [Microvirga sp.]
MPRWTTLLRVLAVLCLACTAPASAEEWWGRTLPNPPENFLFGYGSLINTASRNATAVKPIHAIPVRVAASFGFVRAWVDRSPTGFTALGLRRPASGEAAKTINGVLYPVEGGDMSDFDRREAGYTRVQVPRESIEAVSWEQVPVAGRIWVYVPVGPSGRIGEDLPEASSTYPLLQSYIDVVLDGALEYGPDFAREVIETTRDWSPYWLNDRELGRRPWVFDHDSGTVDDLLRQTPPAAASFEDRLFPEVFAVRHSKAK